MSPLITSVLPALIVLNKGCAVTTKVIAFAGSYPTASTERLTDFSVLLLPDAEKLRTTTFFATHDLSSEIVKLLIRTRPFVNSKADASSRELTQEKSPKVIG